MKRLLPLLIALLLLTASARAEIVGRAADDYIHRWEAPNGQMLYFVSREEEPWPHMVDVNFDGVEDVAVTTFRGASNFGVAFFVWDGGAYVPVEHPGADKLVNYELIPEAGLLLTGTSDGMAGAWNTKQLWRWNGTSLTLVRSAASGPVETVAFEGERMIQTTDNGRVRIRVWDDLNPATYDGVTSAALLFDATVSMDDEETLRNALDEERRILLEGLQP